MDKKIPAAGGPGIPKKKALNDTSGVPNVAQMGQRAAAAGSIQRTSFDDVHIGDPWRVQHENGCFTENGYFTENEQLAPLRFVAAPPRTRMIRFSEIDQLSPKVFEIDPLSPAPMTTPLGKYDADLVEAEEKYNAVLDVPATTLIHYSFLLYGSCGIT